MADCLWKTFELKFYNSPKKPSDHENSDKHFKRCNPSKNKT